MKLDLAKAGLRGRYLLKLRRKAQRLAGAIASKDLTQIGVVAHQLSGSAASYGYEELGTIALQVCKNKNLEGGKRLAAACADAMSIRIVSYISRQPNIALNERFMNIEMEIAHFGSLESSDIDLYSHCRSIVLEDGSLENIEWLRNEAKFPGIIFVFGESELEGDSELFALDPDADVATIFVRLKESVDRV